MDGKRFDDLTRNFATPRSRRGFLGIVGATVGTAIAAGRSAVAAPKAGKPSKCYGEGSHCTNGKQCCSGTCANRQCTAPVVQCEFATDCPGTDTDCRVRACIEGACGFENRPLGSVVTQQTAGDCHRDICDGQGGVVTIIDDTDVPDDGNPCTADTCTNGVLSKPPTNEGGACPFGDNQPGTCVNGTCEEICLDRECASGDCAHDNQTCCPEDDTFDTCTGSTDVNCYCVHTTEGTTRCHEGGQSCTQFGACTSSSTCPEGTFCSADSGACGGMCVRGCGGTATALALAVEDSTAERSPEL